MGKMNPPLAGSVVCCQRIVPGTSTGSCSEFEEEVFERYDENW